MEQYIFRIIIYVAVAVLGFIGGNGAVYCFNKLPSTWLCDYGEVPSTELEDKSSQRIKSYPWKLIFSALLIVSGIRMAIEDPFFSLAGMVLIWLLIELTAADMKYRVLPDQFIVLIAVCSFGFVNFHASYMDMVYGVLAGGGIMLAICLLGKLISQKEALGFGDVKLMSALGLIFGFRGIVAIFIGMSLLSCGAFLVLLSLKKIKIKDSQPLVPYISAAALIYLTVIWQI